MLHVFDMDGTLLPDTSANIEVARHTGTLESITTLERHFASGLIDTKTFASEALRIWGIIAPEIVATAYESAPKLRDIKKTVQHIHDSGHHAILITMSPDFFANHFLEMGFDAVLASRFPIADGQPISPDRILTPDAKPALAMQYCRRYGFKKSSIVAYGDSRSDRPLFEAATTSVAINADHHVRSIATHIYEGDSLWDAYELVAVSTPEVSRSRRVKSCDG